MLCLLSSIVLLLGLSLEVKTQVLTPPYFNLAEGRRITASSTCGVGVSEPELYCKLVGANSDKPIDFNVIQGQLCEYCDPSDGKKRHPPEFAIDGSERWWQSPPLSRGMEYNEVNLTIDLGQLFHVAYVVIKMANSPRPGIWVLEKSVDNGETYTPWQYFADSEGDCKRYFGVDTVKFIGADDDVVCTTRFSKVVPLEGGEIFVSLLNDRPSSKNFFNSSVLQEFTRATNIRLRLIRTKTLLGHLMSVARQDPTVTRRYFYSIKDISIGGRCVCNGHASVCDIADPNDPYKLQCRCQHNTCGSQCEECCPGFIQKKWRPASYTEMFVCEPCNCFGHSQECVYDEQIGKDRLSLDIYGSYEGGGVCQNCMHNTEGINCDKCKSGFFRPHGKELNETDVCQPCDCPGHFYTGNCFEGDGRCECHPAFLPPLCDACNDGYYDYPNCKPCDCHRAGTVGEVCEVGGGQCPCKENFISTNCDQCAPGYYKFPDCIPCNCNTYGSIDSFCDTETGQCKCQNNYGGEKCERCEHGYYDFNSGCQFCKCDARGSTVEICDKNSGECLCAEGFSGVRCDNSAPGFWGYPQVQSCGCHEKGSSSSVCDAGGQCACIIGYSGRSCDQCSPGYFDFPDCRSCNCDQAGSIGISCDGDGNCQCQYNFDGQHCDRCRESFYNFPLCEDCNCDPAGVLETFAGCGNAPVGELCECKERVTGRICNKCKPLFWNLQTSNSLGCDHCECHSPGTVADLKVCNDVTGNCHCKPHVTSRTCNECRDGFYNLMEDNLFGCTDCQCNIGGANHNICDKVSGQCSCRHRIEGQRCDQPMPNHYFPTMYQYKFEIEDGRTPQNTPVRYNYDESVFPGYSWRGYQEYSSLHPETIHDIYIVNPSLYRLIFRFRNPNDVTVTGKITVTPENAQNERQELEAHFVKSEGPELMTVSTINGFPLPLVLDPGTWTVSIDVPHKLFLDYMVLLPQAYYEASLLTKRVSEPSQARGSSGAESVSFAYPDVRPFDSVFAFAGYADANGTRSRLQVYENDEILERLNNPSMVLLGQDSDSVQFDMRLKKPGSYVFILNYFTPDGARATNVYVEAETQNVREKGRAVLYDCTYAWICRQVVTNLQGEIGVFDVDTNYVTIKVSMRRENAQSIALESITAVPMESWNMDLVTPKPVCVVDPQGKCIPSVYPHPAEATKIEFPSNTDETTLPEITIIDNGTDVARLNKNSPVIQLDGKLRYAGSYVFLIHYYQPNHPELKVDALLQNGRFYEAVVKLPHCPNANGCRAVLTHLDEDSKAFDILENFIITLKATKEESVWLDYLLVVPESKFSEDYLTSLPFDQSEWFLRNCANDNFNMDPRNSGICRESTFALTSDYNNGALPCQCNSQGSISFECDTFGGQCSCKPYVIGRDCSQCKSGFYGFPNCRPCNCPSLCDHITGDCICPPRVVGESCDRCALNTFGFHYIHGCEECQCNELGVVNGQLQCDQNTGQCQCKDNIVGRRCEKCADGYWSYPFCQLCNCDLRGAEAEICNQNDASCYCKANTEGSSCDVCVPGTFNLDETNPDGCTKCFCFGKTQSCVSSNLVWSQLPESKGWQTYTMTQMSDLEELQFSHVPKHNPEEYPNLIYMNLTHFTTPESSGYVYLAPPITFRGNLIKSYGGTLSYKILTLTDNFEKIVSREGDVILKGKNVTALHFYGRPLEQGLMNDVDIEISEKNFRTLNGVPIKRDHFMTLLSEVEGIYIRAQYGAYSSQARISHFVLETGSYEYTSVANPRPAASIEQCQCPPNYSGTSCEDCAQGYYRASAGPYGGFCIPCTCNNHADTCDPLTGECLNCRDNTVGFHCESCTAGYFGDATVGTPYDCLICSCPLPSKTNNFAISCDLPDDEDQISCECKPGYSGSRCNVCAPGHYGQPTIIGEYCKPCECNNNIDVRDPLACDDINGLCLSCLNFTTGSNCERCSPGFYGDAILLKNCQKCGCDECGTRECDHYTGVCRCFENVIGDRCDRCAPDYWGFASCQGCHACNCDIAAESRQCDLETGQCRCREGVAGQRCDRCAPGFWKYSEYGCTECSCRTGFSIGVGCDPVTGQCSCLPGVIGDNCEGCPYRWILVPGVGCQKCDECVHALLDTTDHLTSIIGPVIKEYESAAQSFFLHQRLQVINDTISELGPKVDGLDISEAELEPLKESFNALFTDIIAASNKAELLSNRVINSATKGLGLRDQALEVLDSIYNAIDLSRDIVSEIKNLATGLESGTAAKIDYAIEEAQKVMNSIKDIDFEPQNDNVRLDYEKTLEFYDRIANITMSGEDNKDTTDDAVRRLERLKSQVSEMVKEIGLANEQVYSVDVMNKGARDDVLQRLQEKQEEVDKVWAESSAKSEDAKNYTELAASKIEEATELFGTFDSELSELQTLNENSDNEFDDWITMYEQAAFEEPQVIDHSNALQRNASNLDSLLEDSRYVTVNALRAANAYDDIVSGIEGAWKPARQAHNYSEKATEYSSGISEKAISSLTLSEGDYATAESKSMQVENMLLPNLNTAQVDVDQLSSMNNLASEDLEKLERKLESIDTSILGEESLKLRDQAMVVNGLMDELNGSAESVYERLQEKAAMARQLSTNIENAKRDVKLATSQVDQIDKTLPEIRHSTSKLLAQKKSMRSSLIDIGDRVGRIKQLIEKTRQKTNDIKVGIDFDQGSALQLRNPDDLSEMATETEISLYIRTSDSSGLPLFLGTPTGKSESLSRIDSDDFMAIEIDEGYVRLTTNLGSGPQSVVNNVYIADDVWHRIYVKRIGKVVQLRVDSEDENRNVDSVKVEKVLTGTHSIMNLDPKVSKLFVGGIPAGVEVDGSIRSTHYSGKMEELWINNRPIGLWNFARRGTTDFQLKGAKERLVLKSSKASSHILRFDGSGYVKVDTKGHETSPTIVIVASFKTFAEDGLLFLVESGEEEFVSIEMLNGKLVYRHKFGKETSFIQSDGVYNDNVWHTVEATRSGYDAILKVDIEDAKEARSGERGGADFSVLPKHMFFGGFSGNSLGPEGPTGESFRGCIKDVRISDLTVDFSRSIESIGTVPGCQAEAVNLVSFQADYPGYVKLDGPEQSGLQLVFKFRTKAGTGLLFYTETADRSVMLSLSLLDGALVLRSTPNGEVYSGSYTKYNDSEWHIVVVTRENNELRMDIDDFESLSDSLVQPDVYFDGPLFFGGVPEYLTMPAPESGSDANFIGCMGDATLNGKIVDFANASKQDRPGAMLDSCSLLADANVSPGFPPGGPDSKHLPEEVPGEVETYTETSSEWPATTSMFKPTEDVTASSAVRCALPVTPEADLDLTPENGRRFGLRRDSRIELESLPDNIRSDFSFSVEFRASGAHGVVFYAASISHRDFVAIYMNDGKIAFSFNPGESTTILRSSQRYDDGDWHNLVVHRDGNSGRLEVDGFIVANTTVTGLAKHIDHKSPYYLGGLEEDIIEAASANMEQAFLSFNGCLRRFRMNNKIVAGKQTEFMTGECSYKVEPGIFFAEGKLSHAVVRVNFLVGSTFEMYMEIKPRRNSGVLMSVHGRKDFILLQLREGIVEAKVDNGKGIITAQFDAGEKFSLCDGRWHSIKVVKNKHLLFLFVDSRSAEPAAGPVGSSSADTNKPLFIGSQPRLANRRGDAVAQKYVGCMRNLYLNSEKIDVAYILYVGQVRAGVCPTI